MQKQYLIKITDSEVSNLRNLLGCREYFYDHRNDYSCDRYDFMHVPFKEGNEQKTVFAYYIVDDKYPIGSPYALLVFSKTPSKSEVQAKFSYAGSTGFTAGIPHDTLTLQELAVLLDSKKLTERKTEIASRRSPDTFNLSSFSKKDPNDFERYVEHDVKSMDSKIRF